jgi:oligopeptide/dipeptide ABC transporter ATP-binding protein
MYLGKIVEIGSSTAITHTPRHHYTRALLDAVPVLDPRLATAPRPLEGEIPSPLDPPSGCRFRLRCPNAQARCAEEEPRLIDRGGDHQVACHFPLPAP